MASTPQLTAEAIRVDLGQKIKARRESLGMSQEAFAEKAAITQATVSRIEAGKVWPSDGTLAQIANALGMIPEIFSDAAA